MDVITLLLLVAGFVCFVIATFPTPVWTRLVPLGLALWILSVIINDPLLHK
jgi:hypothetical protein